MDTLQFYSSTNSCAALVCSSSQAEFIGASSTAR